MKWPRTIRLRIGLGALLGIVLVGAVWSGWRMAEWHAIAANSIPDRPALSAWPAELEANIGRGEEAARGYIHAKDGLAALSRLYHANGFYNEAIQCYAGLEQIEPRAARWPHLHASILAGFGRLDEALPQEQRAVGLASRYIAARLRLGDILLKTNQLADADKAYSQVLDRDPGNPYALLGLAKCRLNNGDWIKARDSLRQAIRLHPDFIGALSLMATVAEHFGDQKEAESIRTVIGRREFSDLPDPWLDDLLEDCYDAYRLSVTSVIANMAGNPTVAQHLLERAIEIAPENSSYHRQLGLLLAQQGIYSAGAREHYEKAVALSPTDVDAWLQLYQLLTKMGDTAAADTVLVQGLAHCPDSASLHMERARRWGSAQRTGEAIAEFREAYRLNPSEAQPLIELASVLFTVNRGAEALAALQEALRKQPDHPMALATLTFYYISAGDEASALGWWEHVRRQPRTPAPTVDTLKNAFRQRFGRNPP